MGRSFPCAVGRGGIGDKRGEGDGITPVGIHRIEEIWVRSDRLSYRFPLPTRPIGIRHGWSDDPADPAYNRLVLRPHAHSHEAMRRADPMYDLVAVLDWNRAPVVPGRGSAIFLHVWRGPRRPTAGCVAFRRADLAWILANWQAQSRVVIRH
ncbi:L,D-transpeptidase family protein [Amaricoccus macauensis]|uniref:L,D-transpeptidase family protein n=1 Tax=Amaricoccus macauensis TaxID=57001 RepID=UPI003C7A287B